MRLSISAIIESTTALSMGAPLCDGPSISLTKSSTPFLATPYAYSSGLILASARISSSRLPSVAGAAAPPSVFFSVLMLLLRPTRQAEFVHQLLATGFVAEQVLELLAKVAARAHRALERGERL